MADGRVLVTTARGSLVALKTDDGKELWTADVGQTSDAAPVVSGDTAYVTTWNGGENVDRGVAAIDLADGSERWRAIPDVDVSSAATLAHDTVYVGGSRKRSHVIALDAMDGSERWRFRAGEYASTPAVFQGIAYVSGGKEPTVYALDAVDGEERWRVDVDGRVWGAPTISGETVYIGTRKGTVYALAAADGEELWHIEIGDDVRESLAVTSDMIYVPDRGSIHGLSTDGEGQWSVDASSYVFPPTVAGNSVIVTDRSEAFGLDAATGAEYWRHAVKRRTISDMTFSGIMCEPVVHNHVVYVASLGGDVYALQRPE
ncbi:PQQ-binding-like beta-propeller repeat protein [Halosolutus halophilus]|uniref:outer membrane protein assembly factor BamB family protein n=1 Tax=Halosolutus halophilus TaxID=1552990 RepID=UPI002234F4D3|nr:PQQ-binding-like beta-propeller repeat protein [Halosolutus halophilus]